MTIPQTNHQSEDHYNVLGVRKGATLAEISKAYKRLALQCHPDKNQENREQAEEKFKRVSEAYSALSDSQKRRTYDQCNQRGTDGSNHPASRNTGYPGMSQQQTEVFFKSLFGHRSGFYENGSDPYVFRSQGAARDGVTGRSARSLFGFDHGSGGLNIDVGSIFKDFDRPTQAAKSKGCKHQPECMPPLGVSVVIRSLVNRPEHNGKIGVVKAYDGLQCEYLVALGDTDARVSVKRQNFIQQCSIEVVAFQGNPDLNGTFGEIVDYEPNDGGYVVFFNDGDVTLSLPRGNCLLRPGSRVVLEDLSNETFNGKMAQVITVDRSNSRYTVQCESGEQIKVKYEKVVC